jgi:hypothetical protein
MLPQQKTKKYTDRRTNKMSKEAVKKELFTFRTPSTNISETKTEVHHPANICPEAGAPVFEGAEYARRCNMIPSLCSCMVWMKPEAYNQCSDNRSKSVQM